MQIRKKWCVQRGIGGWAFEPAAQVKNIEVVVAKLQKSDIINFDMDLLKGLISKPIFLFGIHIGRRKFEV